MFLFCCCADLTDFLCWIPAWRLLTLVTSLWSVWMTTFRNPQAFGDRHLFHYIVPSHLSNGICILSHTLGLIWQVIFGRTHIFVVGHNINMCILTGFRMFWHQKWLEIPWIFGHVIASIYVIWIIFLLLGYLRLFKSYEANSLVYCFLVIWVYHLINRKHMALNDVVLKNRILLVYFIPSIICRMKSPSKLMMLHFHSFKLMYAFVGYDPTKSLAISRITWLEPVWPFARLWLIFITFKSQ